MSAALFASLVWAFAPPPPPPPTGDTEGADAVTDADTRPPPEDPGPGAEEPTPEEPTPEEPTPADDEIPLDERYDPILPYGETPEEQELEYADETPPPPELEYADETPPPPELEYDQTRQRQPPADEALNRESDEQDELGEEQFQGRVESPQRFAIEVKFGPYLPNVDARYTGTGFGPYATIFGEVDDLGATIDDPRKGLLSVLSFEWQFYHLGGPFSLGATIGYFRDKADALIVEDVGEGGNLRSSADQTRFHVIPLTLLLGYRFELLADRYRIPLVPYARGGVAYGFWLERKGGQYSVNSAGQKSRGGSWGWQANLGLMLRLDFIERAAAVDLDRISGINHTYLFGEWQFSHIDGFGSDKAMSVGDDTFLFGLAFEF